MCIIIRIQNKKLDHKQSSLDETCLHFKGMTEWYAKESGLQKGREREKEWHELCNTQKRMMMMTVESICQSVTASSFSWCILEFLLIDLFECVFQQNEKYEKSKKKWSREKDSRLEFSLIIIIYISSSILLHDNHGNIKKDFFLHHMQSSFEQLTDSRLMHSLKHDEKRMMFYTRREEGSLLSIHLKSWLCIMKEDHSSLRVVHIIIFIFLLLL